MFRRRVACAVVATGVIAVAGCGGDRTVDVPAAAAPGTSTVSTAGTPAPTRAGSTATSVAASAGSSGVSTAATPVATTSGPAAPEALQFTAPLVGGGTLDAASLAGTPVLFWFWAPY